MASINDLATAAIATSAATGGQAGDALPVTTPPAGVVRGAFIAFEGLDRSGKTTQVKLLEQRLIEEGKKVKVMRFPGVYTSFVTSTMFFYYLHMDGASILATN